jgi:hypothetical protein
LPPERYAQSGLDIGFIPWFSKYMRKLTFCIILIVLSTVCFAQQQSITLDNAIYGAGNYIEQKLQRNSIVAIINFSSPSAELTNYVMDGIIKKIVDDKILRIVDRRNLENVAKEIRYQLSGDVSDSSAKRIGQQLGADSVITGGITQLGNSNMYRMSFQMTHIETAEIQGVYYADIPLSNQLNALIPSGSINSSVPQNNIPPAKPQSNGDPNYRVYYFRNITQKQFGDLLNAFIEEAGELKDYFSAVLQDGGTRDPYLEYSINNRGIISVKVASPFYSYIYFFGRSSDDIPGKQFKGSSGSIDRYASGARSVLNRFNIEKNMLDEKYGNPSFRGFFRQ